MAEVVEDIIGVLFCAYFMIGHQWYPLWYTPITSRTVRGQLAELFNKVIRVFMIFLFFYFRAMRGGSLQSRLTFEPQQNHLRTRGTTFQRGRVSLNEGRMVAPPKQLEYLPWNFPQIPQKIGYFVRYLRVLLIEMLRIDKWIYRSICIRFFSQLDNTSVDL